MKKKNQFKKGQRVVLQRDAGNGFDEGFDAGTVATIKRIDTNDSTVVVTKDGRDSRWIPFGEIEVFSDDLGWGLARKFLPEDAIDIFEQCFDGIESLILKKNVRDHLVAAQPDLIDRLRGFTHNELNENMKTMVFRRPTKKEDAQNFDPMELLEG